MRRETVIANQTGETITGGKSKGVERGGTLKKHFNEF